jgi:predicted kinase
MLVLMAGLPGCGKSALARGLAAALPGVVLDKDRVRAALFPPERVEYSTVQDDFCQGLMEQTAAYLLRARPDEAVIFDGRTFSQRYQRARLAELARELGVALRVILCVCDEEVARARLERDATQGTHPARNRDFGLYLAVRARFEPLEGPHLRLDTAAPLEECVARALAYLGE